MRPVFWFTALLVLILLTACTSSSGGKIEVYGIHGPSSVEADETVSFQVSAVANDPVTYQWAVNPPDAGIFSNSKDGETDFTASLSAVNTEAVIIALLHRDDFDPVIKNKSIYIGAPGTIDHSPTAKASVGNYINHPGDFVYFYDKSTDPDGNDDIVKWEWDFTYDESDGFQAETTVRNPVIPVNDIGTYTVQLRVTDSQGNSDLLDTPLVVSVTDSGWVTAFYDTYSITDIAVDSDGSQLLTGFFYGTTDFSTTTTPDIRVAQGISDVFLIRLDPSGNLEWVIVIPGNSGDPNSMLNAYNVRFDQSGNAVVTGFFRGATDFDPGSGYAISDPGPDSTGAFVASYSASGEYIWHDAWFNAYGVGLDVSDNGDILVCGSFYDETDFDPGSGTTVLAPQSGEGLDAYVNAFDSVGNHKWVKTWNASKTAAASAIALDDYGNVYVMGTYKGVCDLDPGPGSDQQGPGGWNMEHGYLSSLDADGDYRWGRSWYSDTGPMYCMDLESSGDYLYLLGYFDGTIDFDPGSGVDEHTNIYSPDYLLNHITCYSTYGTYLWTNSWGTSSLERLGCDPMGNVYCAGTVDATVDIDPSPGEFMVTDSAYVSMFLPNGVFAGAVRFADEATAELYVNAITIGHDYGIYISGTFGGTVDFDPGADVFNVTRPGAAYIYKLFPPGTW